MVSIGVPVYNGDKYISECLDSIIAQTYQTWECVIIDNCSTDNTNAIVTSYMAKDQRIKLVKNKDFLDVMQNWNETYRNTSPEAVYFKIVPADDWLMPEYLSETVTLLENNAGVGICSSYRIDGSKVRGNGLDIYKGQIFNGKKIVTDELLLRIDVTGSGNTVIFRNSVLRELPIYPKIFSEVSLHVDTELAYDILSRSDFGFIFKVLSYTRRHNESITNSMVYRLNTSICFRDNQLIKHKNLIDDFKKHYRNHRVKYAILFAKRFLNRRKDWLKWHKTHLENKFTFAEVVGAIICNNLPGRRCHEQDDQK